MSLNTLVEQILLSEKQLQEQTDQITEVEGAISRCKEQMKNTTELCTRNMVELGQKAQTLSAVKLQHDRVKKSHEQMLNHTEKLLKQKSYFCEHLAKIKKQYKEEETKFFQEISRFNTEFSLLGEEDGDFQILLQTMNRDLEKEVESLRAEMEQMICQSSHFAPLHKERTALQQEQLSLAKMLEDLDQKLKEAKVMTESLKAERLLISQKPLTDSTCLRLRKELEVYKEEQELELLRETLSSEIQFLKSKLDSRQSNQH